MRKHTWTAIISLLLIALFCCISVKYDATAAETQPTQTSPENTMELVVLIPYEEIADFSAKSRMNTASLEPVKSHQAVEDEQVIPEPQNPYSSLSLTTDEKILLAKMAYNEARGEDIEGQIAVIQVALNRFLHEAYSGTISEIVLAPNQFSVGSTYTETQMEAVEAALAGNCILDLNTDVTYFSTGGLNYGSYFKTIGSHVFRTYS